MGIGGGSSTDRADRVTKPTSYHVMELFRCPPEVLSLPVEDRRKIAKSLTKSAGPEGFKPNANAAQSSISFFEELSVVSVILACMGAPWTLIVCGVAMLFTCSWPVLVVYLLFILAWIYHPLPKEGKVTKAEWLSRSPFTIWMYKYFSYRIVWADNIMEEGIDECPAWIGCGGPHGVMPFGNVLSIPAINQFTGRKFVGAAATVVFGTPGVKYMSLLGCIDVSAKSMTDAVSDGICVGMVPDGIAGIFRSSKTSEVFYVRERKGLAKLSLRTGIPIIPVYSIGNSEALSAAYDPFGIAEFLSRKLQAAMFVFWGRWGLPVPFRTNVSLLLGRPIKVEKMAEKDITQADVDRVHQRMLDEVQSIFDTHKEHLGWGHKTLTFE